MREEGLGTISIASSINTSRQTKSIGYSGSIISHSCPRIENPIGTQVTKFGYNIIEAVFSRLHIFLFLGANAIKKDS